MLLHQPAFYRQVDYEPTYDRDLEQAIRSSASAFKAAPDLAACLVGLTEKRVDPA
ncbi:hypothetical protein [Sodalis-like endosymbiont of Proechinophthirus fluctus]|uniref:hypothetical protein n=1 Tax=Sodalis-like endosymbiont of Proechinophthirus fluctus TaxID=1462730 RepID=UPI000A6805F1|nr:hypothetical protein [Sodalis-like endosymbiont of Proechinophthirus fluctus]